MPLGYLQGGSAALTGFWKLRGSSLGGGWGRTLSPSLPLRNRTSPVPRSFHSFVGSLNRKIFVRLRSSRGLDTPTQVSDTPAREKGCQPGSQQRFTHNDSCGTRHGATRAGAAPNLIVQHTHPRSGVARQAHANVKPQQHGCENRPIECHPHPPECWTRPRNYQTHPCECPTLARSCSTQPQGRYEQAGGAWRSSAGSRRVR